MPSRKQRRRKTRLGASATEFAIIAPLFFTLIFGILEFGRALMVQQVIINASRVGARQATTTGATSSAVIAAVQQYTTGAAVSGINVSVTPDPATAAAGATMTVTTTVPYNSVSWLPAPWFLGGKTLTATSKMRKEGFQ